MNNEEKILELLQIMKADQEKANNRISQLQDDVALMRSEHRDERWAGTSIQRNTKEIMDDVKIIKEDLRDVKRQVNVLYDWVDGLDLQVKDIRKSSIG